MPRRLPQLLGFALMAGSLPLSLAAQRFEPRDFAGKRWFKGNTHAHTTESDGDSPPEVVARWYKEHGYHFLVLSDHNVLTDPARLAGLADSTFLLIAGEEVTTRFGRKPVHINGLGITRLVAPETDSTLVGTIQRNVDAVRGASGVPHINHPNFGWAFGAAELREVRNDSLLEIFNGHPLVHNEGGDDRPGMEAVWDVLLSSGKRIYGIAVDDAHHFQGEFAGHRANPGRGWVAVAARGLGAEELLRGLEQGLFHASTGVTLERIDVSDRALRVAIHGEGDFKYTTTFIGDGGRVLAKVGGLSPEFRLDPARSGSLTYVRARVDDSGGRRAWVQPVFLRRP
ncbi:MAG: CehA/McbA family metallohydrolase [Gemmatimonadales bacterium]